MLCAGCRVGICVKSIDTMAGCLEWDALIEEPDFIYYCIYCARTLDLVTPVCALCLLNHLV